MADIQHKDMPSIDMHGLVAFYYDTLALLNAAAGFALLDLNKLAYVAENQGYYLLRSVSPIAWTHVNQNAGAMTSAVYDANARTMTFGFADGSQVVAADVANPQFPQAEFQILGSDSSQLTFSILAAAAQLNRTIVVPARAMQRLNSAPAFSATETYQLGDIVNHAGLAYMAATSISAGAFVSAQWWELTDNGARAYADQVVDDSMTTHLAALNPHPQYATAVNWVHANNGADFATAPVAAGANAQAWGNNAQAAQISGLAAGNAALADGARATAIGPATDAKADALAAGNAAVAVSGTSAVGPYSQTTSSNAHAEGNNAIAGNNSVAVGKNAESPIDGVSVGYEAGYNSPNSRGLICVGKQAGFTTGAAQSIFIGTSGGVGAAQMNIGYAAAMSVGDTNSNGTEHWASPNTFSFAGRWNARGQCAAFIGASGQSSFNTSGTTPVAQLDAWKFRPSCRVFVRATIWAEETVSGDPVIIEATMLLKTAGGAGTHTLIGAVSYNTILNPGGHTLGVAETVGAAGLQFTVTGEAAKEFRGSISIEGSIRRD